MVWVKVLSCAVLLLICFCLDLSAQSEETPWSRFKKYYEYVCKTPIGASIETGCISIESKMPRGTYPLGIGLDHTWLKDGRFVLPNEPGARAFARLYTGRIERGQTRVFDVPAGTHEIAVGSELLASGSLSFEVHPGETVKLVCGERYWGPKKLWYQLYYMTHCEIPGKEYFYLKRADD